MTSSNPLDYALIIGPDPHRPYLLPLSADISAAAVLGPDPIHFETLMLHLTSSYPKDEYNKDCKSKAEDIFTYCKNVDPNTLTTKLLNHLENSPELEDCVGLATLTLPNSQQPITRAIHLECRAKSAFLLRDHFWSSAMSTRLRLKNALCDCVLYEQANKKLCDTISRIGRSSNWPELLPFVLSCITSDESSLQESGLLIFAGLAQSVEGDLLVPHLTDLHDVFGRCLGEGGSDGVRIAALNALINLIQCLESSSDRDRFQDLLIELSGKSFLMRQWDEVLGRMLHIEVESLDEGMRLIDTEFVFLLGDALEREPGLMTKLPLLIRRLFDILLRMLLDFVDEVVWPSVENEHEDAGESRNNRFVHGCLGRLAIALGADTFFAVAFEQLQAYLAAPEWQKHLVALVALAEMAEGCSKVMIEKNKLDQVVTMVLNSSKDIHPRVRWAAINAIGLLSTHLGPDLQYRHQIRVIPALLSAMDFQNPRVQARAVSALLKFFDKCTPEIVNLRCLDEIVSKLFVLMKNDTEMVREEALTALDLVFDPQNFFVHIEVDKYEENDYEPNSFMRMMIRHQKFWNEINAKELAEREALKAITDSERRLKNKSRKKVKCKQREERKLECEQREKLQKKQRADREALIAEFGSVENMGDEAEAEAVIRIRSLRRSCRDFQ